MNMATKKEIQSLFGMFDSEPKLNTLEDRIKMQKLVYLSEVSGIDLGFTFTWYIYGPYSPDLTRVMFEKETGKPSNFSDNHTTKKKIQGLELNLGENIKSGAKLELIASLHYVLSIAKKQKISEKNALQIIYDQKPQFKKQEVNDAHKIAEKFL